jgi:hypothetical protein
LLSDHPPTPGYPELDQMVGLLDILHTYSDPKVIFLQKAEFNA